MARKNVTPLRAVQADDATDNLNNARLRLGHILAIADLVAHSNHEELYESTIPEAMYAILDLTEQAQNLMDSASVQPKAVQHG